MERARIQGNGVASFAVFRHDLSSLCVMGAFPGPAQTEK
jgi:hypothetical protein